MSEKCLNFIFTFELLFTQVYVSRLMATFSQNIDYVTPLSFLSRCFWWKSCPQPFVDYLRLSFGSLYFLCLYLMFFSFIYAISSIWIYFYFFCFYLLFFFIFHQRCHVFLQNLESIFHYLSKYYIAIIFSFQFFWNN